jgi:hypothetical protein
MAQKHPGFAKVQAQIAAKEGIPAKNAGAILANAARKSSAKARRKNPRLNRVLAGGHHPHPDYAKATDRG